MTQMGTTNILQTEYDNAAATLDRRIGELAVMTGHHETLTAYGTRRSILGIVERRIADLETEVEAAQDEMMAAARRLHPPTAAPWFTDEERVSITPFD